jgi:hypothetical protein
MTISKGAGTKEVGGEEKGVALHHQPSVNGGVDPNQPLIGTAEFKGLGEISVLDSLPFRTLSTHEFW